MSTQIFQDLFTRSNTSGGGVANGWLDASNNWEILSNTVNSITTTGALLRPTGNNVGSGQPENPVSGMAAVNTHPGSGAHSFFIKWIDATHYIRANFNNTGSAFNLLLNMNDGSGDTVLYNSGILGGGPTTTAMNVCCCKLNAGKVDLYLDVRDLGAPGSILGAVAITGVTFSGAASNGQIGYMPANPLDTSSSFTSYVYDGAITSAPAGTNSGVATNIPAFGSSLTVPGLALTVTAINLSQVASGNVPFTVAASTGGTGTVTYSLLYSDTLGTAPGSMSAVSGQSGTGTSYNDSTLTTTGAIRQYCVKAVDQYPVTPGLQYSKMCLAQIPSLSPVILLTIGESVVVQLFGSPVLTDTYTSNAGQECARILSSMGGGRRVFLTNQAQPSTRAADWLSGGSNLNGAISALNTLQAANPGVTAICLYCLGINDALPVSTSQASFQASVSNTVAALQAQNCVTVLVDPIVYQDGASDNAGDTYGGFPALVTWYPAALDAAAAANPTWGKRGDTNRGVLVEGNTNQYGLHGGVHPNLVGQQQHGFRWAQAVFNVLNPATNSIGIIG